jgi:hypothetical protein
MKIVYRQSKPEDYSFIYATYLRNNWFARENNSTLKRATWSALQHKRLEGFITKVLVACVDEDQDEILGYALMDGSTPYVYLKLAYRSEGLNLKDILTRRILSHAINVASRRP